MAKPKFLIYIIVQNDKINLPGTLSKSIGYHSKLLLLKFLDGNSLPFGINIGNLNETSKIGIWKLEFEMK